MGRTRSSDTQLVLAFGAGFDESMAVMRAQLRAVDPAELGVSDRVWAIVAEVVKAVWAFAGASPDAWCRASAADLAASCDVGGRRLSPSQFMRYRTVALRQGLLRKRGGDHAANAVLWRVDHDAVAGLAARSRAAKQCETVRNSAKQCETIKESPRPPNQQTNKPLPTHSAAASHATGALGGARGGGWGDMILLIEGVGVAVAEGVVREFAQRGGTPAELRAVVEHYRRQPGAWGPGAIVLRLRRWRPGQQAAEAWPPPSAAYRGAAVESVLSDFLASRNQGGATP